MTALLLWLCAAGALVGVLAGLLGVGGGLVLVALLIFMLPTIGLASESIPHIAIGTSLFATVFTALRATAAHHRRGAVLWRTVVHMAPGLVVGGAAGSLLAAHLDGSWLQLGVAAYCFVAAAQLTLGQPSAQASNPAGPQGPGWIVLAAGIGAVSSIVGIGGGSMTVPALIRVGVPPVRAVATSSACGIAIAIIGTIGFALFNDGPERPGFIGAVFVHGALAAALGSVFTAPAGAWIAHRLSSQALKYVFAVFLAVLGCVVGVREV